MMERPMAERLEAAFRTAGGFAGGVQDLVLLSHPSILEALEEHRPHDSRPWATLFEWLFVGEAAHDSLSFLARRTERSDQVGMEGPDSGEMALMWTTLASALLSEQRRERLQEELEFPDDESDAMKTKVKAIWGRFWKALDYPDDDVPLAQTVAGMLLKAIIVILDVVQDKDIIKDVFNLDNLTVVAVYVQRVLRHLDKDIVADGIELLRITTESRERRYCEGLPLQIQNGLLDLLLHENLHVRTAVIKYVNTDYINLGAFAEKLRDNLIILCESEENPDVRKPAWQVLARATSGSDLVSTSDKPLLETGLMDSNEGVASAASAFLIERLETDWKHSRSDVTEFCSVPMESLAQCLLHNCSRNSIIPSLLDLCIAFVSTCQISVDAQEWLPIQIRRAIARKARSDEADSALRKLSLDALSKLSNSDLFLQEIAKYIRFASTNMTESSRMNAVTIWHALIKNWKSNPELINALKPEIVECLHYPVAAIRLNTCKALVDHSMLTGDDIPDDVIDALTNLMGDENTSIRDQAAELISSCYSRINVY